MTPAFVQRVADAAWASGASLTVPVGANTTQGNRLILVVKLSSGNAISGVTDTQGNVWTVDLVSSNTSAARLSICSAYLTKALTTSDSITASTGASTNGAVAVYEYSGLATSSPVDVTSNNHGGSGTSGSASATTTGSDDLIFTAAIGGSSTVTYTTPTGFTNEPSGQGYIAASDQSGPAGTYTAAWSWTTSQAWAVGIVAYKAAGGPTTYTDAQSGTLTLGGASSDARKGTDAQAGTLTLSGSGAEAATFRQLAAGALVLGGSRVEGAHSIEARSGTLAFSGSGSAPPPNQLHVLPEFVVRSAHRQQRPLVDSEGSD